jgi:MFS transporter, MHS family, proline/betaine transporter
MSVPGSTAPALPGAARRRVLAGSVGNLMENYDNLIYAYTASTLSVLFFPTGDAVNGLLATFATFAVGFLARPIGTLWFGHIGDRHGRKRALVISVVMMGAATTAIGLMPTYETIGALAPVLLVLIRLVQGFSVAGEWAGSASMLVESAPAHRRGFFGSFNQVSTAGGFLLAAAVIAANTALFSDEAFLAYGWRVPFLLGAVTAVVAVLLRRGVDDTPSFVAEAQQGTVSDRPLARAFATQKRAMLRGFGFTIGWTVAYFFFLTYLPTYLIEFAGYDGAAARASNLLALVVLTVAIAGFGLLSDRVGRKPLLLAGAGGLALLSWPVLEMFQTGQTWALYVGQIAVALALASFSGAGPAALAELFPTNVRYSSLGIGYNFSVMVFGGTAPFVATALIGLGDSATIVALLPGAAALVTFGVVLLMPESSRLPLR